MTAFRVSSVIWGLAAGVALALAGPAVPRDAVAQQSGPIQLMPAPGAAPPAGSSAPVAPAAPPGPATPGPAAQGGGVPLQQILTPSSPGSAPRSVQGIEINPLAAPAAGGLGTLGPENGGLGADLWRGTSRANLLRLLPLVPAPAGSMAASDLTQRLLLTAAEPPAGGGGEGDLLAARIERLAALGALEPLRALLESVPRALESSAVAQARVEIALLDGEDEAACQKVANEIALYSAEPFWQKALIFCQLRSAQSDQARLGLDLLREQGGAGDDPEFVALAESLAAQSGEPPAVKRLTPLNLALLRAAGRGPSPEALEGADPLALPAIAANASYDMEQRAAAAERAVATATLAPEALAEVYAAFPFAPDELARAISAGSSLDSPRGRALLYQAAKGQTLPAARAEILSRALEEARGAGLYRASAAVLLPLIAELPVGGDLLWFSGEAAHALYATGRLESAEAWHALLRQAAGGNTQAAEAERKLWPIARLAGGSTSGDFAGWHKTLSGDRPAGPTLTLLAALAGLGEGDLPLADYVGREASAQRLDPLAALALDQALQQPRRGEALLLALLLLGSETPETVHPLALEQAVAALARLGLEPSARALAVEAALAAGW